jgi:hypothetical protein
MMWAVAVGVGARPQATYYVLLGARQQPRARLAPGACPCSLIGAGTASRFTYTGPTNGPIQRPNPVRCVQYGCYETTARSEVCRNRNTKIGPYATRAQMGRPMAHIAHQPGPVCLESGVSRWLVGSVGLGGGAAPAPTRGAWGASSIRVA